MQTLDWNAVEARAKKMGAEELAYAIVDCVKAAEAIGEEALGKDASYYRDEASVYRAEIRRRHPRHVFAGAEELQRQVIAACRIPGDRGRDAMNRAQDAREILEDDFVARFDDGENDLEKVRETTEKLLGRGGAQ